MTKTKEKNKQAMINDEARKLQATKDFQKETKTNSNTEKNYKLKKNVRGGFTVVVVVSVVAAL